MELMLDTQIFDCLADKPALISTLNLLQENKRIAILSTHIQEDELAGIKDKKKSLTIAKIKRVLVNTADAVYGVSKYGRSTYGDGSNSGVSIHDIRLPNTKNHTRDALIATSASRHADIFVTEDKRLRNCLQSLTQKKCKVWNFLESENWIISQKHP